MSFPISTLSENHTTDYYILINSTWLLELNKLPLLAIKTLCDSLNVAGLLSIGPVTVFHSYVGVGTLFLLAAGTING